MVASSWQDYMADLRADGWTERSPLQPTPCTTCGGPTMAIREFLGKVRCDGCNPSPRSRPRLSEIGRRPPAGDGQPSILGRRTAPDPGSDPGVETWPAPVVPCMVVPEVDCDRAMLTLRRAREAGWDAELTYAVGYRRSKTGPVLEASVCVRARRGGARRVGCWSRNGKWSFTCAFAWGDQTLTKISADQLKGEALL